MKLLHVDAFTSQAFHGNPAAVCLLNAAAETDWMQRVGAEMNLSETAFVYPLPAEGSDAACYHLRWFTPTIEVDLCGHATLATAHALWEEGLVAPTQQIRFETRSGTLIADRFRADGSGDWICLDFPATLSQPLDLPRGLQEALGLTEPPLAVEVNSLGYIVQVASAAIVAALEPNFTQLQTFAVPGTIVTAAGDTPYDFTSRFFAPNLGINEDPVTGSAHCSLAPYWHQRQDKTDFLAYQASARGGILQITYQRAEQRVKLRGQAVTVLRGELLA
ncbi:MAG: PhzF family phenazine biosynthesis protein [Prochlorotrichaceae cyanobacterium]